MRQHVRHILGQALKQVSPVLARECLPQWQRWPPCHHTFFHRPQQGRQRPLRLTAHRASPRQEGVCAGLLGRTHQCRSDVRPDLLLVDGESIPDWTPLPDPPSLRGCSEQHVRTVPMSA
uniref:hypothetical protein n=1 Tax=Streptomyces flaveolus TaxID=67297 RepID=UPI003703F9CA